MDPTDVQRRIDEGILHLKFVATLYRIQLDHGRRFLHENPESAASWRHPCIDSLFAAPTGYIRRI